MTPQDRARILTLAAAGVSKPDIARLTDRTEGVVYRVVAAYKNETATGPESDSGQKGNQRVSASSV